MTTHHEVVVDNVTVDHNEEHEDLAKWWNRREVLVPCVVDGTTDNTALIEAYHDDATPGDMLILPRGPIAVNPFTLSKMLHLRGAGRFATWFVPLTDSTDPLITVDRTIDSGHGIFANYGPTLEGFGVQRLAHMAGPCLSLTVNSPWVTLHKVLCSGGTRSIEHHAPNATFEDVFLWDASDAMIDMDEFGLELHLRHVVMSANVVDLDTFIRVTIAGGGGLKGALYIDDVTGNTSGTVDVTNGLVMSAPSLTEVPTFAEKLVLDNITGGGPVIDLDHIQSVTLRGWANGSHGCVRMDGCAGIDLALRTRGGTHTYEFVGDATTGIKSRSEIFTGPAYKITGAVPVETDLDDAIAGATTIAQVTNNAGWLLDAGRRTWKSLRLQGMLRQREAGASPPRGFGNLVAGVLTVSHASVQTNTRIGFYRGTAGATGTPGLLMHDVADNVAGTSFKVKSTSASDTGRVHWFFLGDAD